MATEGAQQQVSNRRKWIMGLLAVVGVGVAIALAVVFTVGGQGPNKSSSDSSVKVSSDGVGPASKASTVPATVGNKASSSSSTTKTPVVTVPKVTTIPADDVADAAPVTSTPANLLDNLMSTGSQLTNQNGLSGLFGSLSVVNPDQVASKTVAASDTCYAADAAELSDAVVNGTCRTVVLTDYSWPTNYALEEEILVSRHVTIVGNPQKLPYIDCSAAVRCFHVVKGGFINLKFLKLNQGAGVTHKRGDLHAGDGVTPPIGSRSRNLEEAKEEAMHRRDQGIEITEDFGKVVEIRGGAVYIEAGGGTFTGVVFRAVFFDAESVRLAAQSTVNLIGARLYGGHVMAVAGVVVFNGCLIWDMSIVLPLTDQLAIGGDVLVLAGEAIFTGCTFISVALFGVTFVVGVQVAVLGGVGIYTLSNIFTLNIISACNGIGQTLLVGGGLVVVSSRCCM